MLEREVFITGGTGYMGQRLIPRLLSRGHRVRALVRPGSEQKLPPGCVAVSGDPLKKESFADQVAPAHTFVQLVGVAHPGPTKGEQFRAIDLVSGRASVAAAAAAGVKHFVYVSVAQPSSMMKDYITVRAEVEGLIRGSGMDATILRPWYVLGPGHRWPYLVMPIYWMMELIPSKRETARRLGLVTLPQMLSALVMAVDQPAKGIKLVEVPEIKSH